MKKSRLSLPALVAAASLALVASALPAAEPPGTALPPASAGGIDAIDPLLRKLETNRRLLIIAAHPDDEDTALLTLISRGMGGEAAYLSLSRGDGGQNLIGDDLGVGLGLIRTGELNAARHLDGARQFFTRAYDFGYSRNIAESLRLWPKDAVMEDAVRVIRRFRPQVVVAIFSGTPRDGHGQHQESGIIAREAFKAAGDPAAFPGLAAEGLRAWQPAALYQTTRFLDRDKTTLVLPTGGLEPLTGRSFQQIAVASRSLHRSQGTGALQPIGPNEARVGWLEGGSGRDAGDLFAGTDSDLASLSAGIADPAGRRDLSARLSRIAALARQARARLSPASLSDSVPAVAAILTDLRAARAALAADAGAAAVLDEKISSAESALAAAAGIALDALADRETATPGETLSVTVQISNAGGGEIAADSVTLVSPDGWTVPAAAAAAAGKSVASGALAEWKLSATLPSDALPTVPYFLRSPLRGAMYDWSSAPPAVRGEPFGPPPLSVSVTLKVGGVPVTVTREATFRYRDEEYGEIRRAVRAVPRIEVFADPPFLVLPIARAGTPSRFSVTVASNAPGPVSGRVEAQTPAGWTAAPASFSLAKKGDRAFVELELKPPASGARPGRVAISLAAVLASGERFRLGVRTIDYEHIRPTPFPREASVSVTALDLKLPKLSAIGYVRGASDRVPEALLAVGVPLRLLSGNDLEHGSLSSFDAIVLGVRAYETEPALANANGRLLDWVRAGGLLIVQYQQLGFTEGAFAPEKLEITRPIDRVTDETAPVTILDPSHPIFRSPNSIGPADWEGWVQERGIYFAHTWTAAYTPLLSMQDPGEPEQRGSLLAARVGKGRYIYTGLAFFRELPAGVPGAYRLFANLLAWRGPDAR
ncbi:MAG: PIG-L family deacetylase [Acidobacteriota bacterium]